MCFSMLNTIIIDCLIFKVIHGMNTEIVSKNKWFCFYLKNEFFCVKVTENLVYIMSYQTSNHQGKYSLCLWETPGKDPGAG